jgi:hypothetical protein
VSALFTWIKKYGQWLGGGLLLVLGFLVGVTIRKRPVLVSGDNATKTRAEAATQLAEDQAAQHAEDERRAATATHAAEITRELTTEQAHTGVAEDPAALNEYLKDAGSAVRGPSGS